MLDAVFWWCAIAALAGSAALVVLALLAGRPSRFHPAGVMLLSEEPLTARHFGRA